MISEENAGRVFELIEHYAFADLSDDDKQYIRTLMSEEEYHEMRQTITGISNYLGTDIEPPGSFNALKKPDSGRKWKTLLLYPVQLYKVAAAVIILISFYMIFRNTGEKPVAGPQEKIVVLSTDTVFQTLYDTVKIIEKIPKKAAVAISNQPTVNNADVITADCITDICPHEISQIAAMTNRNNLSNDPGLRDVLTMMN